MPVLHIAPRFSPRLSLLGAPVQSLPASLATKMDGKIKFWIWHNIPRSSRLYIWRSVYNRLESTTCVGTGTPPFLLSLYKGISFSFGVLPPCHAGLRGYVYFYKYTQKQALVSFQFQIHLWNWRIAKRFGTACSRDGSGNRRLRTETLEFFSKFRKKSGILAPSKPPLRPPMLTNF